MIEKIQILAGKDQYLSGMLGIPESPALSQKSIESSKTLIIMVHDFPGNKNGNNDVFIDLEALVNRMGFHSLRFDCRGCGESDGLEENYTLAAACEDFQSIVFWAKQKGFKEFVYIGEGLGGTLAVMNTDLDVKANVLLWPILNVQRYEQEHYGLSRLKDSTGAVKFLNLRGHRIGLNFMRELMKTDLEYAMKEMFMPTFILHGTKDEVAPVSQLDIARRKIPAKRLEITTIHDGGHGLKERSQREMMYRVISQFIEKYA